MPKEKRVVAIGQARMGSTRAPGKVMRPLGGVPVFVWVARALYRATGKDHVVIATSTLPEDDAIANECIKRHIECFRGSESDVRDRFYQCAKEYKADIIVRVTCDCPFLDPRVISEVIKLREITNADYASNISPPTYPDGLDVECMTFAALEAAWKEATRPSDRDAFPQYIYRNRSRFPAANLTCPIPGLDKERWVLDTEEDWGFCQEVAKHLHGGESYIDILNILDKKPELREINNAEKGAGRNERFFQHVSTEPLPQRKFTRSDQFLDRATKTIPFGAQTFSKSYLQFTAGSSPLFASHADGARIYDVDGNDYVDLVSALLPVILGYRDPDVDRAIRNQLDSGISFSLATELEIKLSEMLCRIIPCAEMVKLGKNGTDVTTAAIRLARAYTGREHVLLSGYHGWADWSMSVTERNLGIPHSVLGTSHRTEYGKPDWGPGHDKIAAIIVEPNGNPGYLKFLREYCTERGIVLIFDEIITGFRYDLGGAQKKFGVTPDLACFGKAMGNGMPISALVGRRDIMKRMEPPNNIFYSGTFFGETLSIAAAIATIEKIERENVIGHLISTGMDLEVEISNLLLEHRLETEISLYGDFPRLMLKFNDRRIGTLFSQEMAQAGVLIANSNNLSFSHRKSELMRIVSAYDTTFGKITEAIRHNKLDDYASKLEAPLRNPA